MQKLMATDISRLIMAHVRGGGWLGAGWPYYVIPDNVRVTQFQLDKGYALAVRDGALSLSEDNFRRESLI